MKRLFFLLLFPFYLYASQQVVFVLANEFSSQKAKLVRYEKIGNFYKKVSNAVNVNLGLNGLAWGVSDFNFDIRNNKNIKKEGDKKAVAGVFKLSKIYTYKKKLKTKMPFVNSTKNHICVDDTSSSYYNQIIKTKNKSKFKSYENMLLSNDTYKYVIKVEHNPKNEKAKGSCIFLHIENPKKIQTSGCTSMKELEIKEIISWLEIKKEPILIQIPKSACKKYQETYPFIECDL